MKNNLKIKELEKRLKKAENLDEIISLKVQMAFNLHYKDREKSLSLIEELEQDIPKIQDEEVIGWFHYNKAWHLFDSGNYKNALKEFQQSKAYFATVDSIDGLAAAQNGMGNTIYSLGEFDQALPVMKDAMIYSNRTGNKHQAMKVSLNIGSIYMAKKKFSQARVEFMKALDYFTEMKDEEIKVPLYINIGNTFREENLPQLGREWIQMATESPQFTKNPLFHCDFHLQMGYCFLKEENLQEAEEMARKGIKLAKSKNVGSKLFQLMILLAEILLEGENYEEAEEVLLTCPDEKTHQLHLKRLEMLSKIAEIREDLIQALFYKKEYLREYSLIYNPEKESAFSQSRLKELEEQQKRNLIINDISKDITRLLDMEKLTQSIYKSLNKLLPVDIFAIGRKEANSLCFDSFIEAGQINKGSIIELDDPSSFAVWAVENNRSIIINDLEKEQSYYLQSPSKINEKGDVKSLIYLPMKFDGEIIGVFTIQSYREKAYTVTDISLLEALESYISIAMENSKRAKRLETLSEMDFLTGIANRRKLDTEFTRISQICRRQKQPVTLLMIDVDHFKKFNDCYGHDQGDLCLKILAEVLSQTFQRPLDLYGRFGGEEFLVILGDTNEQQGEHMAELLRKRVKATHWDQLPEEVQLTISLGGITFSPSALEEIDMLHWLKLADEALYQAKESGRNRICWSKS